MLSSDRHHHKHNTNCLSLSFGVPFKSLYYVHSITADYCFKKIGIQNSKRERFTYYRDE